MRQREGLKLYFRELFGSLAMYTLILVAALSFESKVEPGPLRTAMLVSPMLGFLLAIWAVARQFARMDEYLRLSSLQDIAIAGAITVAWTFTYGFLENAGYPRLSMFSVWPVFAGAWALCCILRRILQR